MKRLNNFVNYKKSIYIIKLKKARVIYENIKIL
jgi:hypothetical protein